MNMPNYRVECPLPSELRICASETEVSREGWSLVPGAEFAGTVETMPSGDTRIEASPGFSRECIEVFRNGELQGDLHTAELSNSRTRLCFAPVPPIE
jgi:hypothetical protein